MKIGLPGKLILRDYFQEKRTSRRPFLLLRIDFPGIPILYNWLQGKVLIGVGKLLRLYDLGKKKLLRKSENKVQCRRAF